MLEAVAQGDADQVSTSIARRIEAAGNNAYDSATTENFRTYLEAMNTWYNNGWLDERFNERASDIFFRINENGTAQGMVGLW